MIIGFSKSNSEQLNERKFIFKIFRFVFLIQTWFLISRIENLVLKRFAMVGVVVLTVRIVKRNLEHLTVL